MNLNSNNLSIFIIGSGNIASHMSKMFKKHDIVLSGICSRNAVEGNLIAKQADTQWFGQLKKIPKDSDIYLICVSDDAIKTVVEQLPKSIKKSKIIAHTSGSKSIDETLVMCKNAGVFYPLQTFTKGKKIEYKTVPFCINGKNEKTLRALMDLGKIISESVQYITDEQRKQIHLSAVMINNFVNHLIYTAEDLLATENVDPRILQPLLTETIRKQKVLGAYEAQTGPARRKDTETLKIHLDMLKDFRAYKAIYIALSRSIQKTYKVKK